MSRPLLEILRAALVDADEVSDVRQAVDARGETVLQVTMVDGRVHQVVVRNTTMPARPPAEEDDDG